MPEPALYPSNEVARLGKPAFRQPHECKDYAWRVLHTRPQSLIGYWPLDEVSGTVAHDLSGRGHNGTYVGVDLGRQGIGDGRTCPYFDGLNDYANIYSAGLSSVYPWRVGTILVWGRVRSAAVWTDGTARNLCNLAETDIYLIRRTTTNGQVRFATYWGAVGESAVCDVYVPTTTHWQCYVMTWDVSAKRIAAYVNGTVASSSAFVNGPTSVALSNTKTTLGANTTTPTQVWSGNIAHCTIWNRALSPQEIERLGRLD